jgi:hypothetical protein
MYIDASCLVLIEEELGSSRYLRNKKEDKKIEVYLQIQRGIIFLRRYLAQATTSNACLD